MPVPVAQTSTWLLQQEEDNITHTAHIIKYIRTVYIKDKIKQHQEAAGGRWCMIILLMTSFLEDTCYVLCMCTSY